MQPIIDFQDVAEVRRVIFLVDSDTATKKARDLAELLHDILLHVGKEVPVLVACNKQDLDTAKSSKAIKNLLEKVGSSVFWSFFRI